MYLVIIALLITFLVYCKIKQKKEGWVDYIQEPYKYVKEGSDPVHFYRRDRYRQPYRNGFKFNQSYPYSHQEPLP